MPLIVVCGYPCSGKTRRAEELKAHFEESTDRKVHVVGDGALSVDRNSVYADSQKEKNVRASLKAEVERKVNKDNVVILDSLNYIKGYRYELFCLTKHAQTPHCLVLCLTSPEESSSWNANRAAAAERYSQDVFDALVQRFEAPDSRNRWDSPLFTVLKDDALPLEAISDALFKRKAPPPNQSTQSQPLSSANFLYELDKITQDVLMAIFDAQKTSVPGDLISVPGATEKGGSRIRSEMRGKGLNIKDLKEECVSIIRNPIEALKGNAAALKIVWVSYRLRKALSEANKLANCEKQINALNLKFNVELSRSINMAELRKLRRQFISYSKMHPTENTGQISNMFVQYLNKSLH